MIGNSIGFIPMYETLILSPIFNNNSKLPSKSEITPFSDPITCIVAPARVMSVSFSKTLPFRLSSWDNILVVYKSEIIIKYFFIIIF